MAKKTTKIQLGKLNHLQKELTQLLSEKISFTTKWEIRNILNGLKDNAKNLQETLTEIYKKYGEEDVEAGAYKLKPENVKEANEELKKLTEKKIEITGKLPLKELESIKSENHYFEVFALVEK